MYGDVFVVGTRKRFYKRSVRSEVRARDLDDVNYCEGATYTELHRVG